MIRLLIVDDHAIYTRGLSLLLNAESDLCVTATAATGTELLPLLNTVPVDVLLLDIQLPDYEAEDLTQAVRAVRPDLPILYLTLLRGTRYLHRLLKYHVQGYLLKNAPVDELLQAIRMVAGGGTYFSSEINITDSSEDDYKKTITVDNAKVDDILTKREIEILQLVCREFSSADIAAKLFLSVSTVDTHRKNILIKLGVNNTVGLVKYVLKWGMSE